MTLPTIDQTISIEASRARVWETLTTPALVEAWLGCMGFTGKPGEVFYMQPDAARRAAGSVEGATHCAIEALEPMQLMRFSWYLPGTPETRVEITLTGPDAGPTSVRLAHTGWDRFDDDAIRPIHEMLSGGWRGFVLPGLKRAAEQW